MVSGRSPLSFALGSHDYLGPMSAEEKVLAAWREAALDLGIEMTAPYSLAPPTGEAAICYIALVHGFGAPSGTLLCSADEDFDAAFDLSETYGFYASALNPRNYGCYDRSHFIATLRDWGWRSKAPAPSWYED